MHLLGPDLVEVEGAHLARVGDPRHEDALQQGDRPAGSQVLGGEVGHDVGGHLGGRHRVQSSRRPSRAPPSAKNGRMRFSYMVSAEPIAMCMSRYL